MSAFMPDKEGHRYTFNFELTVFKISCGHITHSSMLFRKILNLQEAVISLVIGRQENISNQDQVLCLPDYVTLLGILINHIPNV